MLLLDAILVGLSLDKVLLALSIGA